MPRGYAMSWDGPRKRWVKMYQGERYTVTVSRLIERYSLPVPETKEGSYCLANRWWKEKKADIDAANRPVTRPPLPLEDLAAATLGDPAILTDPHKATAFLFSEAVKRAKARQEIEESPPVPPAEGEGPEQLYEGVIRAAAEDLLKTLFLCGKPIPQEVADRLPPARVQQLERAARCFRGEPAAAPERTVEAHTEAWLKRQQALVDAGQMTAARCANNRTCLAHFTAFLGSQTDAATIDAAKVEAFYLHCMGRIRRNGQQEGWSTAYAKDVFAVARAFIRWLWEQGTIELPRNANTKFKFGSPAKAVRTWTLEEFQRAVTAAPGKLKLALLLMVNCGMTQQDVSDLRDDEVDWQEGRIIRKRSKTAASENVPTVNYPLWPLTIELLRKYRSGEERVLLTEGGEPYVRTRLNDKGKLVKADGFASNFVHLKRRLNLKRPLKQLRKLGASLLAGHKEYGRFQSYFLGHSPRTVADRHYVVPPKQLFDEAVMWLGEQLGQVK